MVEDRVKPSLEEDGRRGHGGGWSAGCFMACLVCSQHQVIVVAHQAVGERGGVVTIERLRQDLEQRVTIGVIGEDRRGRRFPRAVTW